MSLPELSALDTMCSPAVVRLGNRVFCLPFPLMKIIPARHMIESAWRSGDLHPGSCVVETTSGTLGLGLALVCRAFGLPLILVSDAVVDTRLRMRLEYLGAQVEIVTSASQAIQEARLARVREIVASDPAYYYWPRQYDNPANRASYAPLAQRVQDALGHVDLIVAAVGSGGSACGMAEAIRRATPRTRLVGVDTHGSVLFGLPPGPRPLRGLGNSVMPGNLLHHYFDEVHWVTAELAHSAARALYREHGLYMGPTSGAVYLVGDDVAARHRSETVLLLFPDDGNRYADEVYGERYLSAADPPAVAAGPHFVTSPRGVNGTEWAAIGWARRPLAEMLSARPSAGSDRFADREENHV